MSSEPEWKTETSQTRSPDGYDRAVELIHACCTKEGFLATPTEHDNYRRVWGRDSAIIGLAALLTGQDELIEGCRRSLETLAQHQGPHGEIPSNVDPQTGRVSYGGTAGRVDSDLWFVICCGEYWDSTGDDGFLERMLPALESVRFLLGSWEFNSRGLIYVPPTGDWADEYLQSGYVLFDQLLYLKAQRWLSKIHRHIHQGAHHALDEKISRLKHLIKANYWFNHGAESSDDIYHEILYKNGRKAAPHRTGSYWMPFFSPFGYGYRFDALANVLVTLFGVANKVQCDAVDDYISDNIVDEDVMLLPAFHPVITPKDEAWHELQTTFSHTFKNEPYEYHNGGLWPMITGFYAASLARRGKQELAERYCDGIHAANALEMGGDEWSFPEYVHGKKHTPGGTHPMGWSAAGAIIAEQAVRGNLIFS